MISEEEQEKQARNLKWMQSVGFEMEMNQPMPEPCPNCQQENLERKDGGYQKCPKCGWKGL